MQSVTSISEFPHISIYSRILRPSFVSTHSLALLCLLSLILSWFWPWPSHLFHLLPPSIARAVRGSQFTKKPPNDLLPAPNTTSTMTVINPTIINTALTNVLLFPWMVNIICARSVLEVRQWKSLSILAVPICKLIYTFHIYSFKPDEFKGGFFPQQTPPRDV